MGLLSYVKPAKGKKEDKKQAASAPLEFTEKPLDSPRPAFGTPGSGRGSPWGSRPASLYPSGAGSYHVGDFRNSQADEINEIKCDVMVNWLYQQQMERLWTAGGHDEGVMLKRGRGQYTCCPADIVEEQYGFYKAVETLNVRVSRYHIGNMGLAAC